jgi:hypothetical protein
MPQVSQSTKGKLHLVPLTLNQANSMVDDLHRHLPPVRGHRFSIGIADENDLLRGAIIVGRPISRAVNQWTVAEVTRLTTDGTPNACSALYAAAWRAWRAMGGSQLITRIRDDEPGTSLIAAGWKVLYQTGNRPNGWNVPSRPRDPIPQGPKTIYGIGSTTCQ